jgi:hypothetical protein
MDFEIGLTDYVFGGTFDGVVRHKESGSLYLLEHKTVKKGGVGQMLRGIEFDLQPRAYLWAARQLIDPNVVGVIYTILGKEDITEARLLKNGKPSKAAAALLRTNLEIYEYWIDHTGADRADYEAELAFLANKEDSPIARTVAYFTEAQLGSAIWEMEAEGRLMESTVDMGLKYSQPHRSRYNCPYCPCRDACQEVERDVESAVAILDFKFKQREERGI